MNEKEYKYWLTRNPNRNFRLRIQMKSIFGKQYYDVLHDNLRLVSTYDLDDMTFIINTYKRWYDETI